MDRVETDDGRQQRSTDLAAGDEVAGVDLSIGDAAIDWREYRCPFKIELRVAKHGLGGLQLRLGRIVVGFPLVEVALREDFRWRQLLGALKVIARYRNL